MMILSELEDAGLRWAAAHELAQLGIKTLAELRAYPWSGDRGLQKDVTRLPGCGDVEAAKIARLHAAPEALAFAAALDAKRRDRVARLAQRLANLTVEDRPETLREIILAGLEALAMPQELATAYLAAAVEKRQ
jgi:hypothetical protein